MKIVMQAPNNYADDDPVIRQVIDLIIKTAGRVKERGADVLILGCGVTSVLLTEGAGIHAIDGVPLVTPTVAAVKMVETLVRLKKSGLSFKSEKGYWGRRPEPRTPGEMI